MCGIAGILGERNYALSQRMLSNIRHRGPDGDGIWLSPDEEMPASLCHARLSILDLSDAGSQPFHSQDGRYVLVFNGEIYNFIELRCELASNYSAVFRSDTDTEVLLQGILYEGLEFLNKCNGMWAFCLWDRLEGTATLCRDRFGIKPLYYARLHGNRLAFASEMKGLTPCLQSVNPVDCIDSIFRNQFNYEFSDLCSIHGLVRVQPGTFIVFKNGETNIERWWNTLDHIGEVEPTYSLQVDRWRELFIDSVKLRMRSDVPIGTALSGGLDSSSILAAMAYIGKEQSYGESRISDDWQHGICCSYPNGSLDERGWAQLVADNCGVSFSSLEVDPMKSSWDIFRSLAQVEDPYLTMPLPMLATYQSIKSLGISVTLDGHGADELFSGYGHLLAALRCAKSYKEYQEIVSIEESTRTGFYSIRERTIVREKLKYRVKSFLHSIGIMPGMLVGNLLKHTNLASRQPDAFAERLILARQELECHEAFREMDVFSQVLYEIFHLTILPTLLRNYDRYSMANGLEIRMPFMDWRLVCYSFSLPWQSKLGGTFTKRIQRDSLSGILCDPVRLRRDKIGWNAPAHEWFKGPLRPFIDGLLNSGGDSPYYKNFLIAWTAFDRVKRPGFQDGQNLWNGMLPHLWLRSLNDPLWS